AAPRRRPRRRAGVPPSPPARPRHPSVLPPPPAATRSTPACPCSSLLGAAHRAGPALPSLLLVPRRGRSARRLSDGLDLEVALLVAGAQHLLVELADARLRHLVDE